MNNELISIKQTEFNGELKQTVNARELWQFLTIGKDFSNWMKNRLEDFEESSDYIRLAKKGEANNATMIEYFLTLETAKHISMIERNEKGKQIRSYFIKVEEEFKSKVLSKPQSIADLLLQAGQELKEKERLLQEKQIIIHNQHQKIKLFDEFKEASGNVCLQTGAKELHLKPNLFIKKLKEKGYLIAKERENLPKQNYINMGLFVVKTFTTNDGIESKQRRQTLLTPKGFHYFAHKVLEEFSDIMNEPDRAKYAQSLAIHQSQASNSVSL